MPETLTNLIPVELAFLQDAEEIKLEEGRWFEGFSIGQFTDMWGREIEVKQSELEFYLRHTRDAIEATRAK